MTDSGGVTVNMRDRYAHWLRGRLDAGAWTGAATLGDAWATIRKTVGKTRTMREAYLVGYAQGLGDRLFIRPGDWMDDLRGTDAEEDILRRKMLGLDALHARMEGGTNARQ
jgi:hypothetical protein